MEDATALVIIDVQRGAFHSPVVPSVFQGERLLQRIKKLLDWARSNRLAICFVQHCGGAGHPLEEGSEGWRIHPEIAPQPGEVVIQERYSDCFQATKLKDELESRGIRHLIVAGLQSDYCVDTACRRAFSSGYKVTLAADAHSTWDDKILTAEQIIAHHNAVLGNGFVTLQTTEQITAAISAKASLRP
jgi:nicotinamidase-related amidase